MTDDMRPCGTVPGRTCNCAPLTVCPDSQENVHVLPFCKQERGPLRIEDITTDWFAEPPAQSTIAGEAHGMVYGDRQEDYGHPREDFTRTAIIWTGLLQHKLAEGQYIEAEDIARCMVGVKLARDVHSPKRDNRVDMVGYAITLDRLDTGK
jgi:hypothetical protein